MKKIEEIKLEESKRQKIKILYGNRHKIVNNPQQSFSDATRKNSHEWTAFIEVDHDRLKPEDLITSVTFTLHPTFRKRIRKVSSPPFQITTQGWGIFELQIKVKWKEVVSPAPTVLGHMLSFVEGSTLNSPGVYLHETTANSLNKTK